MQNTIKLKSIEINDYLEKSEADIIFAINFLRSQLSLQDLIVQGIVVEQIFINDVSDIFNFQLLKLELTSFYTGQIDNVILTNMKRFLKNQSSLQMLKLHAGVDVDLIKIILYQLINLKRLYLNDVTFAEINMENLVDKNYSINRLHLKGNSEIYHSLINICRNLQDICFEDVHLNKEIMLAMYYNLNNLRKINFNRCKIENYMVLPTLKKVRFENMGKDQIRDFILFNRQLELIELPTQFEFDSVLNAIFLEFHGNLKAVTYHEQ